MNEQPTPKPPGALRSALFLDVPYILDSLWRWGEFRANRLGSVQFEDPHDYVLRPAWQSGAFAAVRADVRVRRSSAPPPMRCVRCVDSASPTTSAAS